MRQSRLTNILQLLLSLPKENRDKFVFDCSPQSGDIIGLIVESVNPVRNMADDIYGYVKVSNGVNFFIFQGIGYGIAPYPVRIRYASALLDKRLLEEEDLFAGQAYFVY